jgi:hypothetical protein
VGRCAEVHGQAVRDRVQSVHDADAAPSSATINRAGNTLTKQVFRTEWMLSILCMIPALMAMDWRNVGRTRI